MNTSLDLPGLLVHQNNASASRIVSMVVPSVMFAAGVLGNSLALVVLFSSRKEQKHSVFYRLVGALAITDLFGTCATSPIILVVYANGLKWQGGRPLCNYASFMMIFAGLATIFILASMAMDRYLALNKPYFYSAHVSPARVKVLFPVLLAAALLMACLPLIGVGDNVHHFPGTWCFFDYYGTSLRVKFFAYLYSVMGLSALTVIVILNFVVLRTVLSLHRKACEIQMVVFLIGIMTVVSVCWAPLMVSSATDGVSISRHLIPSVSFKLTTNIFKFTPCTFDTPYNTIYRSKNEKNPASFFFLISGVLCYNQCT